MDPLVNSLIGEYRVLGLIGAGGMGAVYKAVHTHLSRTVAIKVLAPGLADGAALQRFYSEAAIQASLRHPGVAEYLGFYEHMGRPCIIMEYVEGETLAALLQRQGPFPLHEAVRIVRDIAAVAGHFHAQGVVHRDLKCANIKLDPQGRIKVLDFGIARRQTAGRLTVAGAVVGTPHTLAPEQIQGEQPAAPTDVWQLGVLLYELLTGRIPFDGTGTQELYARILSGSFTRAPELPASLERILRRCLEKDPARRYPDGAALHQALDAWRTPARRLAPTWPWAVAGAVVVGLLFFAIAGRSPTPAPEPTPPAPPPITATHDPNVKVVTVDTADGPAQVYREGRLVGDTPYQVHARDGEKVDLLLRRPGFKDLALQFEPTERRQYTYTLEAAKD